MQDGDIQSCVSLGRLGWRPVYAFIFREKMSSSQRGITLWEHGKPADLQNNAVLIHRSVTSLNMKHPQIFLPLAIAPWQILRERSASAKSVPLWPEDWVCCASKRTVETVDCIWPSCLHRKRKLRSSSTSSSLWPPLLRNPDIFLLKGQILPPH